MSNSEDECSIHGYEPIPERFYRICHECRHCFVTEQELIKADFEIRRSIFGDLEIRATSGDKIHICPECTHDF